MTIAETKAQLRHVLRVTDNKVIALTGKWGTGKTYLMKDIYGCDEFELYLAELDAAKKDPQ